MVARKSTAKTGPRERVMIPLLSPQDQEFETGDLGTIGNLLSQGYRFALPGMTYADAVEVVGGNQPATASDVDTGQAAPKESGKTAGDK